MKTKARIQLLLTDENARNIVKNGDIVEKNNCIGNVIELFEDNVKNPMATLEHNYWVLDGQYQIPNNENDFNLKSTYISNNIGVISPMNSLTIDFNEEIKAKKISITYGTYYNYYNSSKQIDNRCNGSRANTIYITLTDGQGNHKTKFLQDYDYSRNYSEFDLGEEYSFVSINLSVYQVSASNRTAKIDHIYFGEIKQFEDEIISANVLQETSYLCDILPIGTLEFEISTQEDIFNPLSPNSILDKLKVNTLVKLLAKKDDVWFDYGTYFLKTWENSNNKTTKFNCEDGIGILENIEGKYMTTYNILGTPPQTGYDIMAIDRYATEQAQSLNFNLIFPDFEGVYFGKYRCILNNTNYRDMLQKMYFGFVGYIITCTGNNIKTVVLNDALQDNNDIYTNDDIILDTDNLKQIRFVKSITVNNHILTLAKESGSVGNAPKETLLNETLNAGDYVYTFDSPYYFFLTGLQSQYPISNGLDTEKKLYLRVNSNNTQAKIEGVKYNEEIILMQKENVGDVKDNSKIVVDNYNVEYNSYSYLKVYTDVSYNLINAIADYYSGNRYEYTFSTRKLRNPGDALGRYIEVQTNNNKKIVGNITKIQTDLYNGMEYTITLNGIIKDVGGIE